MNDAGEKNEDRPTEEDATPTASAGPGMAGLGEQIGRYKLLRVLGERPHTVDSLKQLVILYEVWSRPEQAAKWRAKLVPIDGVEK
jgi:hypothetical protein